MTKYTVLIQKSPQNVSDVKFDGQTPKRKNQREFIGAVSFVFAPNQMQILV